MRLIDKFKIEYWFTKSELCDRPCLECEDYEDCKEYNKKSNNTCFWKIVHKLATALVNFINNKIK